MDTRIGKSILADSQEAASSRKRAERAKQESAERAAFDRLIAQHQASVRRLVSRLLAWPTDQANVDDVVQEVFLNAWKHRRSFRGESEASTWLNRIAINKCRNYVRGRVAFSRVLSAIRSVITNSRDATTKENAFDSLHESIAKLKPRDREVIVLKYLEGRSSSEIAAMLDLKQNTIDARIARARKRLETLLSTKQHTSSKKSNLELRKDG